MLLCQKIWLITFIQSLLARDRARKIQGDDVPLGSERVTDNKNNGNGIKVNFRGS